MPADGRRGIDPARDTAKVLGAYVTSFNPRFAALRGSEKETRRIAMAYKTYYEKITPPGSSFYFIDHTAFIYLLDRDGKYVAFFPPGTTPERMTMMVRELLAQSS